MRVEVTAGATEVGELVGQPRRGVRAGSGDNRRRRRRGGRLPAGSASGCGAQGELSGLEAVHRVAGIAAVLVCRIRELAGMWVTVAV
jgi:hypothetical protein